VSAVHSTRGEREKYVLIANNGYRLLFAATTVMAAVHCWNTRGTHNTKHDPAVEVHTAV
jgi:hypothetical protein